MGVQSDRPLKVSSRAGMKNSDWFDGRNLPANAAHSYTNNRPGGDGWAKLRTNAASMKRRSSS